MLATCGTDEHRFLLIAFHDTVFIGFSFDTSGTHARCIDDHVNMNGQDINTYTSILQYNHVFDSESDAAIHLANISDSTMKPFPSAQLYSTDCRANAGLVVPQPSRIRIQSNPLLKAS